MRDSQRPWPGGVSAENRTRGDLRIGALHHQINNGHHASIAAMMYVPHHGPMK